MNIFKNYFEKTFVILTILISAVTLHAETPETAFLSGSGGVSYYDETSDLYWVAYREVGSLIFAYSEDTVEWVDSYTISSFSSDYFLGGSSVSGDTYLYLTLTENDVDVYVYQFKLDGPVMELISSAQVFDGSIFGTVYDNPILTVTADNKLYLAARENRRTPDKNNYQVVVASTSSASNPLSFSEPKRAGFQVQEMNELFISENFSGVLSISYKEVEDVIRSYSLIDGTWKSMGANNRAWTTFPAWIANGRVNDIHIDADNNRVIVVGNFDGADEAPNAKNIAIWDGEKWNGLGNAINDEIRTVTVDDNGYIYIGGRFMDVGGDDNADYIAKWDGSSWGALGSGLSPASVSGSLVESIEFGNDGLLYVGGYFEDAGGLEDGDRIASWDPQAESWGTLAMGLSGFGNRINDIEIDGDRVYVTGSIRPFITERSLGGAHVAAYWDGSVWSPISSAVTGGFGTAIAADGDNVYIGNRWLSGPGVANNSRLIHFDGSNFGVLGVAVSGSVLDIDIDANGDVLVGGSFRDIGRDSSLRYAARWDGSGWHDIGGGLYSSSSISGAYVKDVLYTDFDNSYYMGGEFEAVENVGSRKDSESLARFAPTTPNYNISGIVKFNGEVIPGAIIVGGPLGNFVADENGEFSISGVRDGVYKFTAILPNGQSTELSLAQVSGDDASVELVGSDGSDEFYMLWNAFLNQVNLVALHNASENLSASVKISFLSIDGDVLDSRQMTLSPMQEQDVLLNTFNGFIDGNYGIVKIESTPSGIVRGHSALYRFEGEGVDEIGFAMLKELTDPIYGTSYATFNTHQASRNPADSTSVVIHWLQIANLNPSESKIFTVNRYLEDGTLHESKKVTVPPMGRRDVHGGHQDLTYNRTGLIEVIPEDLSSPYAGELSRYGGNSTLLELPTRFSFGLMDRLAQTHNNESYLIAKKPDSGENWLELYNPTQESVQTNIVIHTSDQTRSIKAQLPAKGVKHIFMNPMLGDNEMAVISSSNMNVLIKNTTYMHDSSASVTAAYTNFSTAMNRVADKFSTFNFFLGQSNSLKAYNFEQEDAEINVTLYDNSGSSLTSFTYLLEPGFSDIDIKKEVSFMDLTNSYGTIKVSTDPKNKVLLKLNRQKMGSNLYVDMEKFFSIK